MCHLSLKILLILTHVLLGLRTQLWPVFWEVYYPLRASLTLVHPYWTAAPLIRSSEVCPLMRYSNLERPNLIPIYLKHKKTNLHCSLSPTEMV